jgi:hypothetical protein
LLLPQQALFAQGIAALQVPVGKSLDDSRKSFDAEFSSCSQLTSGRS